MHGLEEMNMRPKGAKEIVTPSQYLKTMLMLIEWPDDEKIIGVLTTKDKKPLGYGIVFDNTEFFGSKTALAYAFYSTGRNKETTEVLLSQAETWARDNSYKTLTCCTRRPSGAAKRFFVDRLGFSLGLQTFTKQL